MCAGFLRARPCRIGGLRGRFLSFRMPPRRLTGPAATGRGGRRAGGCRPSRWNLPIIARRPRARCAFGRVPIGRPEAIMRSALRVGTALAVAAVLAGLAARGGPAAGAVAGQITIDQGSDAATLDPALQYDPASYDVYRNIFDTFLSRDPATGRIA